MPTIPIMDIGDWLRRLEMLRTSFKCSANLVLGGQSAGVRKQEAHRQSRHRFLKRVGDSSV